MDARNKQKQEVVTANNENTHHSQTKGNEQHTTNKNKRTSSITSRRPGCKWGLTLSVSKTPQATKNVITSKKNFVLRFMIVWLSAADLRCKNHCTVETRRNITHKTVRNLIVDCLDRAEWRKWVSVLTVMFHWQSNTYSRLKRNKMSGYTGDLSGESRVAEHMAEKSQTTIRCFICNLLAWSGNQNEFTFVIS